MPRKRRVYIPNQPQHIVVRGHNREPVLAHHEDFRVLYQCLYAAAATHQLAVHAWVFMHNHLHLLATSGHEHSLAGAMQSVGRSYATYFNRRYHRRGALWEGRYKSALVDTERYLLCCYRYIELNPVRAWLTRRPGEYPYSSYHRNALGREDKLVSSHEVYRSLVSGVGGLTNYQSLFDEALSQPELTAIRRGTEKTGAIGNPPFLLRVARLRSG